MGCLKLLNDYYSFGMQITERSASFATNNYRYGFNGMENDNNVSENSGDYLDFGARIYDSRLGRWMSIDPAAGKYPGIAPYVFVANNPLLFIDVDGKKIIVTNKEQQEIVKKYINSQAQGHFEFNDKGELYMVESEAKENNSSYYRDKIIEGINDEQTILIVVQDRDIIKDYKRDKNGKLLTDENGNYIVDQAATEHKLSSYGGEATFGGEGEDIVIFVSSNGWGEVQAKNANREGEVAKDENNNTLEQTSADLTMHALVGHAIPRVTNKVNVDIDAAAVVEENKVRKQLGSKGSKLRKIDDSEQFHGN